MTDSSVRCVYNGPSQQPVASSKVEQELPDNGYCHRALALPIKTLSEVRGREHRQLQSRRLPVPAAVERVEGPGDGVRGARTAVSAGVDDVVSVPASHVDHGLSLEGSVRL